MKRFAGLYAELDATTSTRRKTEAMARYFAAAPAADAAWAAYFLAGGRPRRLAPMSVLRATACRLAGLPDWLFEECYQAVGDLAETIALLLPPPSLADDTGLEGWMRERLLPLRGAEPERLAAALEDAWQRLEPGARFVLNKLLTGGFRVGVSRQLVIRALAEAFGVDPKLVAHRFVGYTDGGREPDARSFAALVRAAADPAREAAGPVAAEGAPGDGAIVAEDPEAALERAARPYPFFLAQPLQQAADTLGEPARWLLEWKWDGIRIQLVRRSGRAWIWSRGEELVTDRFPEIVEAARALPDGVVLDGELLCWNHEAGAPMPFALLQRRIGRLRLGPKLLREAPVAMLAYDLLEHEGRDLRGLPQAERRARLVSLLAAGPAQGGAAAPGPQGAQQAGPLPSATAPIAVSPLLPAGDWAQAAALRERARAAGVEGLMLKRADAGYGIGRTKSSPVGDWWKWKIDPLTADCVLVYAQRGHGRRASLYTDYTFALWNGPPGDPDRALVPFAKAYSGLTDAEIREVDAAIRRSTIEKFGPVRSVAPTMVFEIAFEGIQRSTRHRSGIAVRFPRIARRRPDKPVDEADTLQGLLALLDGGSGENRAPGSAEDEPE
ncbi:cisplatin damage response ATP-dependent DNA ligase [Burkholderiaceae bacterium FT117]|uniref:cisplatin damage response ATP-dependent DNA ligase n=1 Tax=Zeimonas sediminis TaxID=2944268 RepID=UPI002342E012|nr:cisplatin damage response ATP-dependent DNA ligase [Zeimonas sediminis]MCM5570837.1 cisplatin damage response ATP-dependent DNA ligase [Zeimonas sediminis]